MQAIGFDAFAYQLAAYVIAGALVRACRLPARQPDRVRQPRLHVLAALGRAHRHGDPRRARLALRRDLGAAAFLSSRRAVAHHRALEDDLRPAARARRAVRAAAASSACCRRGHAPWLSRCSRLEHLRKAYGALVVTDDVTLDVAPGELHAVIGPNGAGKTTLIHQISGLARPTAAASCSTARHHPPADASARAARACALVPDHLDPAALHGAGERRARRAGALRLELPFLRRRRRRAGAATSRRWSASTQVGLARARAMPAGPCRMARSASSSSPSRSPRSRSCCCSTSPWPAPATRKRSAWSRLCGGSRDASPWCSSSTTWRRCSRSPTASSVLVYGRVIATGTPEAVRADPSARGLSRRRGWLMLTVDRPPAGYGAAQVLFGCRFAVGRRRGRDAARPQRHGQDHDRQHHHGPRAAARRRDRASRAARSPGSPPYRIAQRGIGLVPEGRQVFPTLSVRGEPRRDRGRPLRRRRAGRSSASTSCSRGWRSAAAISARSSPAASSRCWRSAAR